MLTADVPININLLSTIVNAYINLTISVGFEPVSGFVLEVTAGGLWVSGLVPVR